MSRFRILSSIVILFTAVGGAIVVIFSIKAPIPQHWSYRQFVPLPDPERRQEPLGDEGEDKRVDMSAFVGMPESYSEAALHYVEAVFSEIKAAPIMRRRFYHEPRERDRARDHSPYPDGANPISDRETVVSISVLPRPDAVKGWAASNEARNAGWIDPKQAVESRGSIYGMTLIFEPGQLSVNPISLPASPFKTEIPSWDVYTRDHNPNYFLKLGKIVVTPSYESPNRLLTDESADLRLGEKGGATLLGQIITVPAFLKNHRLRWVSRKNGADVRRFLAYSLLDGNGARQVDKPKTISPYVRSLVCAQHQPRIKQHDLLLMPAPLGWPTSFFENNSSENAHEEWCLDDWFSAQKEACWVIREAEDSKPLQESFLLMPASEPSERPVFFIALFAETEPAQLVTELATLYKVSPDAPLNSAETMTRLQSIYEKVRDFRLGK